MRGILWLDFNGQPKDYANLSDGEQVVLDTFMTHPWMITDGPGNCLQIVMPHPGARVVELSGGKAVKPAAAPKPAVKAKKPGCGKGQITVDGKCMSKQKAVGYCGPGYRPQGGKCVQGYVAPKRPAAIDAWLPARLGLECAGRLPRGRLGHFSASMRRLCLILIAIALGAASPLGDADSDPEALITAIYQTYTDVAPGEDGVPNIEGVYSERLQALIDKDAEGDAGRRGRPDRLGPVRRRSGLAVDRAQDRAGIAERDCGRRCGRPSRILASRATFSTRSCWRTAIGASTISRRR